MQMRITLHGIGIELEVIHEPARLSGAMEDCTPESLDYDILGACIDDADEMEAMELDDLLDSTTTTGEVIEYLGTQHDEIIEKIREEMTE